MIDEQPPNAPEQEPIASFSREMSFTYRVIVAFLALLLLCSPFTFILEVTPRELRGRMFAPFATWRVRQEIIGLSENNPAIDRLSLDKRNINYLPEEIGALTNLKMLSVDNNNLTTLPAVIGNLHELEELHLINNDLETLPREVKQLEQLEVLNLSGNQLTAVPEEIGYLSNLRVLNLNNNCELATLPVTVVRLTELEQLFLQNTRLTPYDIPQPLLENPNLRILFGSNPHICPPQKTPNPVADTSEVDVLSLFAP